MCFTVELSRQLNNDISGADAVGGTHPFPSRTRRLRPKRPMVLHWRRCGRAGGCQLPNKKTGENVYEIKQLPTEAQ